MASLPHATAGEPPARFGVGRHLWPPVGSLPPPAHLVEPASHGCRGPRKTLCGLARGGEGGPTPPGAAPAIRAWGGCAYGAEGAHEPGPQDGQPHGEGERAVLVDTSTKAPSARGPHETVHAGARAQQAGRHRRRGAACGT